MQLEALAVAMTGCLPTGRADANRERAYDRCGRTELSQSSCIINPAGELANSDKMLYAMSSARSLAMALH